MDQDKIRNDLMAATLPLQQWPAQPDDSCKKRKIKIARWIIFFPFTFSVVVALILLHLSNVSYTPSTNSDAYRLNIYIFTGLLIFCVLLNIACLITGAKLLKKARDC